MKINIITLLIVFAISALAGYGLYSANGAETDIPLANAIGGGLAFFITLAGASSVSSNEGKGTSFNIKMVSMIFFIIVLAEQIFFSIIRFKLASYIIATGLIVLLYILIAYSIGKTMSAATAAVQKEQDGL